MRINFIATDSEYSFVAAPSYTYGATPVAFYQDSHALPNRTYIDGTLHTSRLGPLALRSDSLFTVSQGGSTDNVVSS